MIEGRESHHRWRRRWHRRWHRKWRYRPFPSASPHGTGGEPSTAWTSTSRVCRAPIFHSMPAQPFRYRPLRYRPLRFHPAVVSLLFRPSLTYLREDGSASLPCDSTAGICPHIHLGTGRNPCPMAKSPICNHFYHISVSAQWVYSHFIDIYSHLSGNCMIWSLSGGRFAAMAECSPSSFVDPTFPACCMYGDVCTDGGISKSRYRPFHGIQEDQSRRNSS
jgi:hypothetical protein